MSNVTVRRPWRASYFGTRSVRVCWSLYPGTCAIGPTLPAFRAGGSSLGPALWTRKTDFCVAVGGMVGLRPARPWRYGCGRSPPFLRRWEVAQRFRRRAWSGYKRASCGPRRLFRRGHVAGCRAGIPCRSGARHGRRADGGSCGDASAPCSFPGPHSC